MEWGGSETVTLVVHVLDWLASFASAASNCSFCVSVLVFWLVVGGELGAPSKELSGLPLAIAGRSRLIALGSFE